MLNTLMESVIRCHRYSGRLAWTSLPETYVALMSNEVMAFPALCVPTSDMPGTLSSFSWAQWPCTATG